MNKKTPFRGWKRASPPDTFGRSPPAGQNTWFDFYTKLRWFAWKSPKSFALERRGQRSAGAETNLSPSALFFFFLGFFLGNGGILKGEITQPLFELFERSSQQQLNAALISPCLVGTTNLQNSSFEVNGTPSVRDEVPTPQNIPTVSKKILSCQNVSPGVSISTTKNSCWKNNLSKLFSPLASNNFLCEVGNTRNISSNFNSERLLGRWGEEFRPPVLQPLPLMGKKDKGMPGVGPDPSPETIFHFQWKIPSFPGSFAPPSLVLNPQNFNFLNLSVLFFVLESTNVFFIRPNKKFDFSKYERGVGGAGGALPHSALSFFSVGFKSLRSILNPLKLGFLFGIFVDAFKVGS